MMPTGAEPLSDRRRALERAGPRARRRERSGGLRAPRFPARDRIGREEGCARSSPFDDEREVGAGTLAASSGSRSELDLHPELDDAVGWDSEIGSGSLRVARDHREEPVLPSAWAASPSGDERFAPEIIRRPRKL